MTSSLKKKIIEMFQQLNYLGKAFDAKKCKNNDQMCDNCLSKLTTPRRRNVTTAKKKINAVDEALINALKTGEADENINFTLSLIMALQQLSQDHKLDAKIEILKIIKKIRLVDSSSLAQQQQMSTNDTQINYMTMSDSPTLQNGQKCFIVPASSYSSDSQVEMYDI
ncbi:hypothetical protein CHUAL_001561 [Chamberlinius hualienensis]